MSESRQEYIMRVYGCSEASWQHWDTQDVLHGGHIPGTATEKKSKVASVPVEAEVPKKTKGGKK